jgi:diaminopimelate decarboxylase
VEAIATCGEFIAQAAGRGLGPLDTLDIGGGFAIDYLEPAPAIDEFCRPIRAALARLPKGVRVIAEPGRYICGPAGIALSTVMGRSMRAGAGGITSTTASTVRSAGSSTITRVSRSSRCAGRGGRGCRAYSRVPPATAAT